MSVGAWPVSTRIRKRTECAQLVNYLFNYYELLLTSSDFSQKTLCKVPKRGTIFKTHWERALSLIQIIPAAERVSGNAYLEWVKWRR